ncbi:MAG: 50S ribosomal protein L20 [Gammaproteobacteria bacterium]|nr:50S ribosomal protein L20 [Gammaproteobacteria bacterium]
MPRPKRSVTSRARRKKILKQAKGYYGARSRSFKVAKQAVIRAGQYAYRDRRQRKRQFRSLWIMRINAATRQHGLSYSRFIAGLKQAEIDMDRRVLADLALQEPDAFSALVEKAKDALLEGTKGAVAEGTKDAKAA